MPPKQQARRPNPTAGRNRHPPPPTNTPTIFTERAKQRARKRVCPQPLCEGNDEFEDGACIKCGYVVDDSHNIVSEITFGESGSGAAIVQGSFIAADQGASRNTAMPGQRSSGGGGGSQTLSDATNLMKSLATQLKIRDTIVTDAGLVFKMAQIENFIQGRRVVEVAAVSLYVACRRCATKDAPCRVMLIDFSDKININVFRLGRVFTDLLTSVNIRGELSLVLPEHLMHKFASRLEFGDDLDKVAESAIKFGQRMDADWITMGRRPSGICGAALLMAARMHNYRRTLNEVVYVVKITTQTLQKRLDEFKRTESSNMTIAEWESSEFLSTAHDPPSFYEKTAEFQAGKKKKKKKRKRAEPQPLEEELEAEQMKRKESELAIVLEKRLDADGFAIPAIPSSSKSRRPNLGRGDEPSLQAQTDLVDQAIVNEGDLDALVNTLDGRMRTKETERERQEETERNEEARKSKFAPSTRGTPSKSTSGLREGTVDGINSLMSQILMDPYSIEGAMHHAEAEERVKKRMILARENEKHVNMDVEIGEDEFADDPDVQGCLVSDEDFAKKEQVWLNSNKSYLLREQRKKHEAELAARNPPIKRRNRVPKPRIGEGQTKPADSPAAAAQAVAENRGFSKRLDYTKVPGMWSHGRRAGSVLGSRAGSILGSGSERSDSVQPTVEPRREGTSALSRAQNEEATAPESVADESDFGSRDSPARTSPVKNSPEPNNEDAEVSDSEEEEIAEEIDEFQDAGYDNDSLPDIDVDGDGGDSDVADYD
ncbi:hypothetical protein HYALB_00000054 [Hymenoscyphus albidus]|uniref:Cyclin-like domain-containing protein n=1 Tax=Hymenoscyphus albidus TaxID=595503 RepID=A0A9N9Q3E3_9HELO|nr:hypothetical protein HYALB_00000054 [Hymenoscyphus albidus]